MSSVPSPSDEISRSELMPQRDGTEGTVDRLNEAPQVIDRLRTLRDSLIHKSELDLAREFKAIHLAEANGVCMAIEILREGQPGQR